MGYADPCTNYPVGPKTADHDGNFLLFAAKLIKKWGLFNVDIIFAEQLNIHTRSISQYDLIGRLMLHHKLWMKMEIGRRFVVACIIAIE